MNKKNLIAIVFAIMTAMLTFACLGGAATATSVPPQEVTETAHPPTEHIIQNDGKLEITSMSGYIDSFNVP